MKILLVNTYDFGGAANSCIRLHFGLLHIGIDSKLLLKTKSKSIDNSVEFQIDKRFLQKVFRKIRSIFKWLAFYFGLKNDLYFLKSRSKDLELFSFPISECDITNTIEYQEADIVHFHWVSNFLDWKSFFIKNTKPVVWTFHDQNPFLGGEHYAERFLGMDVLGNPINRKYSKEELFFEEKLIKIKKKSFIPNTNLHVVCPSQWLLSISQKSDLFKEYPHYLISNGFPTEIFGSYDKDFCKKILGLDINKTSILFVADSLLSNRKGFLYLKRALENLLHNYNSKIEFCALGNGCINSLDTTVNFLGRFNDDRMMAIAYNASDVFVIPSLEDNLPNTMIESLLCGTPVIGFPTGGITETIENGVNGIVCESISVQALTFAIQQFLTDKINFNRYEISLAAKKKFNLNKQANAYLNLYKSIFGKKVDD